jgi:hypothetical protein
MTNDFTTWAVNENAVIEQVIEDMVAPTHQRYLVTIIMAK